MTAGATQRDGGPIWGSGEEESSPVNPSMAALSGSGDLAVVGAGGVGEVHCTRTEVAAVVEECIGGRRLWSTGRRP
jgi:hypothetical protein